MDKVIFSNEEGFKEKVSKIKVHGLTSLHIVSDFDLTLTKAKINNQRTVSTWEVFKLGEDYIKERDAHIATYMPIEYDPNVPLDVKNEKMHEWWNHHLNALIKYGLTKELIDGGTLHALMSPRKKLGELCNFAQENKIPFLILSAGLGDVIKEFFLTKKMFYPNMHIVSNFFIFDSDGKAAGFQDDIVHSYNKSEVHLRGKPHLKEIENRKNVILLGDSPGDILMVQGLDYENVIKIGFLNGKEEKLEAYKELYDVVILGDDGVDFVLELLNELG